VTNNSDNGAIAQTLTGINDMAEHRFAADLVHHFRRFGTHACSFTSSKNNGFDFHKFELFFN
jgi:hypothetical protein